MTVAVQIFYLETTLGMHLFLSRSCMDQAAFVCVMDRNVATGTALTFISTEVYGG